MPQTSHALDSYPINEYLLVLSPHEELWNKITKIKYEFAETYQSSHAKWGKPHITLVNFVQYEMMEAKIIKLLAQLAKGFHEFMVELKDYGSFPSHTIYINITSKLPVQNITRQIRSKAQQLMKLNKDNKPHFILEPHLTIARKLVPWQYEKAWLEYGHSHFSGRFVADYMLLLKRPAGQQAYRVADRFNFQNLRGSEATKLELFE